MPTPVPAPYPGSGQPAPLPPFLARNMCMAGNVGVPVDSAETCSRLYGDYAARPTNGMPVECAVVSMDGDGSVRLQVARVATVGQCWGLREMGGMPVQYGGWCTTRYADGINHWRLDVTRQECSNSAVTRDGPERIRAAVSKD